MTSMMMTFVAIAGLQCVLMVFVVGVLWKLDYISLPWFSSRRYLLNLRATADAISMEYTPRVRHIAFSQFGVADHFDYRGRDASEKWLEVAMVGSNAACEASACMSQRYPAMRRSEFALGVA